MEPNPKPTTCWSNIVKQPLPPSQQRNGHPAASAADGIFVGNCKSTKGIAVAVVDANAIIQGGEKLHNRADKFVSVSEVIDEVRDPRSRHSLNLLPFSVDSMEPSPDSLKKALNDGGLDSLIALAVMLLFHALLATLLWSYFSVVFTDPGSVPLNWRPVVDEENGDTEPLAGSELSQLEADPTNARIRFCRKCNQLKPPRCHHCSVCGVC